MKIYWLEELHIIYTVLKIDLGKSSQNFPDGFVHWVYYTS